jgi:hypothetical protein
MHDEKETRSSMMENVNNDVLYVQSHRPGEHKQKNGEDMRDHPIYIVMLLTMSGILAEGWRPIEQ